MSYAYNFDMSSSSACPQRLYDRVDLFPHALHSSSILLANYEILSDWSFASIDYPACMYVCSTS